MRRGLFSRGRMATISRPRIFRCIHASHSNSTSNSQSITVDFGAIKRLKVTCIGEGVDFGFRGGRSSWYASNWLLGNGEKDVANAKPDGGSSTLLEIEDSKGITKNFILDTCWTKDGMEKRLRSSGVGRLLKQNDVEALIISKEPQHDEHYEGIAAVLRCCPSITIYGPAGVHPRMYELLSKKGHRGEVVSVSGKEDASVCPGFLITRRPVTADRHATAKPLDAGTRTGAGQAERNVHVSRQFHTDQTASSSSSPGREWEQQDRDQAHSQIQALAQQQLHFHSAAAGVAETAAAATVQGVQLDMEVDQSWEQRGREKAQAQVHAMIQQQLQLHSEAGSLRPDTSTTTTNTEDKYMNTDKLECALSDHVNEKGELSLILKLHTRGFVVVTNYGRAGVLNILDYVKQKYQGKDRLHALVGGLNLSSEHQTESETESQSQSRPVSSSASVLSEEDKQRKSQQEEEGEVDELIHRLSGYDVQYFACNSNTHISTVEMMVGRKMLVLRGTMQKNSPRSDYFMSENDTLEFLSAGDHMGNEVRTTRKNYRPLYSTDSGFYKKKDESDCEGSCFLGECTCKEGRNEGKRFR